MQMEYKTILVVEDNELNMKLVRSVLQIENYQIIEAENAEKGIQLASDHHPDLILMDIQLPGMDGLKAAELISNDENLKDIPIVALTSYAMEGDKEKALAAGCVGYITKPIETRGFSETIAEYFL
jgi:CheY-like chemotaxis protein